MHAYQPDRIMPDVEKSNLFKDLFSQHPALTFGAFLSIAAMGFVFSNALWMQTAKHPSPMFSTRVVSEPKVVQTAIIKTEEQTETAITSASSPEVLREVQSALSVRGYYSGKVDGKFGSRTKTAIVSFQQDHSLKQDGRASVRLLSQILLSASASPKEVPIPKSVVAEVDSDKELSAKVAKQSVAASGLVAQIQTGLRNYGYEELVVDGKPGRKTKTAIQRFQLDYGMKITGEPTDTVLNKLREIGAYTQG